MKYLSLYKKQFCDLHVKITDGKRMPHKAILLISIIDLLNCGYITSNKIYLDDTIKDTFELNWLKFIKTKPPTVWTPFWHMKKELFWHFCPITSHKEIEDLVGPGETASIGKMRTSIRYAYLDNELYYLLKSSEERDALYYILVSTYLR